jgi:hypothetical protein
MSKRCAALDRWRRRTRKNRLAMPAPEAPLDWRKARAEPALPGRAENYRWWMDADWILVHDPRQARHVLGRSESQGSFCGASATCRHIWLTSGTRRLPSATCRSASRVVVR